MQIIEGLKNLGLNEKEAKIYTHLLQSGQTTAYAIAELTGIKRPTVYVVLEELRMRGLVLKIPHAKKQLFTAKSPEELFLESENKLNTAKSILPQLLAITRSEKRPKTYLFEGVAGYREAINMSLEEMEGKEILGFYSQTSEGTFKVLNVMNDNFEERKKLNIITRAIVPDHESMRDIENRYENFKFKKISTESYSAEDAVEIGESCVKIFSKDLQTVVIQDKNITKMFRQIFEMVWEKK